MQLGNLAEWVAAVGTVAAFGATFWLLRHEVNARRADEHEAKMRQARLITIESQGSSLGATGRGWGLQVSVRVTNDSPAPVRVEKCSAQVVALHADYTGHGSEQPFKMLRGEGGQLGASFLAEPTPPREPGPEFRVTEASVVFRDRQGNRWRVDDLGHIDELDHLEDL